MAEVVSLSISPRSTFCVKNARASYTSYQCVSGNRQLSACIYPILKMFIRILGDVFLVAVMLLGLLFVLFSGLYVALEQ